MAALPYVRRLAATGLALTAVAFSEGARAEGTPRLVAPFASSLPSGALRDWRQVRILPDLRLHGAALPVRASFQRPALLPTRAGTPTAVLPVRAAIEPPFQSALADFAPHVFGLRFNVSQLFGAPPPAHANAATAARGPTIDLLGGGHLSNGARSQFVVGMLITVPF